MDNSKNISRREALKMLGVGALGLAAASTGLSMTSCKEKGVSNARVDTRPHKIGDAMVSLLGFGCMRFPETGNNQIDEALSQQMVDYAYEHGVNYFDTAFPYHRGESEGFIGKALKKYPRESFYLADKMPTWEINSLEKAKEVFQIQLDRCQVEYFDFYLLHAISTVADYERAYEQTGAYDYLLEEKAAGRIRRLGFSFHGNAEALKGLLDKHDWDFVQIQLNYYDWDGDDAKTLYNMLVERDIPVVVMEPIRGGMLANLNPDAREVLKKANKKDSPAAMALRFVGSLPGVMTVLSGMSAMEHVTENVETMADFRPMTEEEKAACLKAASVFRKTRPIRCTGCKYCMPCPFGVDIPGNFAAYNECVQNSTIPDAENQTEKEYARRKKAFDARFAQIPEEARANKCRKCNKCVRMCPQHLPIPQELERIASMM